MLQDGLIVCEEPKAAYPSLVLRRKPLYVGLETAGLRPVWACRECQHAARLVHARKGGATPSRMFAKAARDIGRDSGVEAVVGAFQDINEPG